jgi:glycosyltransferase involved in cell wall biosynthesis
MHVIHLAHNEIFTSDEINDFSEQITSNQYILYIGNRSKYKNFHFLLEAYSNWKHQQEIDFIVVSNWAWESQELKLIHDNNLTNSVHLVSHISDENLTSLYANAVALVYPSVYEGFGIPLLEAMAARCIVVASKIPATVEVAGEYPIYFELNDTDSLLAALNDALADQDRDKRNVYGQAHLKRFSWDITSSKTLEIYNAIS